MVKQAEEHEVLGIKLKGKLTAGENLADLGGLRLSLRALKKKMGDEPLTGKNAKLVDGFNPLQRFFLSWATVWRQVRSKVPRVSQLPNEQYLTPPSYPSCALFPNRTSRTKGRSSSSQSTRTDPTTFAPMDRCVIWRSSTRPSTSRKRTLCSSPRRRELTFGESWVSDLWGNDKRGGLVCGNGKL